ncbi:hypothetical protein KFE26_21500 [Shewanella sp. M16]|uniref:hypothetical protein n=1 Tax=Shewanella sp. M16 TaxID=2830837 RepID=UPI001BB060FE|nr:hypothetical protein [Shewanella sp. M16]MBS0044846.1 hypothetical protein [Shewanella sp. M16]
MNLKALFTTGATRLNKLKAFMAAGAVSLMATNPVLAAGGLDSATAEVTAIQKWLYGILFVVALIYMMYQIGLAMADKQPWGDVIMAFGKVALAGAAIVGATWAWMIWGS